MDSIDNPWAPSEELLESFYQTALIPQYEEKKQKYDIGGGESISIPGISYKQETLKPDTAFERGGRKYKPKDMFYGQNDGRAFKPLPSSYKQKNVDKRVADAKRMPKLEFALAPVKLIKPRYGKLPKSLR